MHWLPTGQAGAHEIFTWPSVFANDKIKRDAGYAGQTIDFREGTRRTLAWLEENGKIEDSDGETYEDELVAAWQAATAALPRRAA